MKKLIIKLYNVKLLAILSLIIISAGFYPDEVSASWSNQVIESGLTTIENISVAVDSNNRIHVAFIGGATNILQYMMHDGSGWHGPNTIAAGGKEYAYPSITTDLVNNKPHVAYYNTTDDQLQYSTGTEVGDSWGMKVVDTNGDVGKYASLALDGFANPHIAYFNSDNNVVQYIKRFGKSWSSPQVVDNENVLMYVSLALDGYGNPHIAYADDTFIRYAKHNSTGGWERHDVDTDHAAYEYTSIALDGHGHVHVIYIGSNANDEIHYATSTAGLIWGKSEVTGFGEFTFANQSLALDGAGTPHITYYDVNNYNISYASRPGGAWNSSIIDSGNPTEKVGEYCAITVDRDGFPSIVYSSGTALDYDLKIITSSVAHPKPMGGNNGGKAQSPTHFYGSNVSTSSIYWRWTTNADNDWGYRVYQSSAGGNTYLAMGTATLTTGSWNWTQTGLSPNTSYHTYAAAVNAGGVVTSSSSLRWTLAKPATGLTVTSVSTYSISISWAENNNPSYTRWSILSSTTGFNTSTDTLKSFSDGYTDKTYDDDLTASGTYWYKVAAYNGKGSLAAYTIEVSTYFEYDNTAPGAVTDLSASLGTNTGEILLSWTAPGDDDYTGTADSYDIRYSTDQEVTGANWGGASSIGAFSNIPDPQTAGSQEEFTVTGLTEGTYYYFGLKSYDNANNLSDIDSAASRPWSLPKSTSQAVPANNWSLSGSANDKERITWTWTEATNASGYYYYDSVNGSTITYSSSTLTRVLSGLVPNTKYTSYITPYNGGGNGQQKSDSCYTLAEPPTTPAVGTITEYSIKLSWVPPVAGGGVSRYRIRRQKKNSGSWSSLKTLEDWDDNFTKTSYTDKGLDHNTQYRYYVYSYNAEQVINTTAEALTGTTEKDETPPPKPKLDEISDTVEDGGTIDISGNINISAKTEKIEKVIIKIYDQDGRLIESIINNIQVQSKRAARIGTSGSYITNSIVVSDDGEITGGIKISDLLTEKYPTATGLIVKIQLEDAAGNKSGTYEAPDVVSLLPEENQACVYNNLMVSPGNGNPAYINYSLTESADVLIKLYDMQGRLVSDIFDDSLEAGIHITQWDGKNDDGDIVASGVYYLHIKFDDINEVHKIIVVK
ncbi:fibronectin type III domain-containing protein [Elusimicrobiota bacterium]